MPTEQNRKLTVSEPMFHLAFSAFETITEAMADSQFDQLRDSFDVVDAFFRANEPAPERQLNAASDRLLTLCSELQVDHDIRSRDVAKLCAELATFYDVNPEDDDSTPWYVDPIDTADYEDAHPDYPPFPSPPHHSQLGADAAMLHDPEDER